MNSLYRLFVPWCLALASTLASAHGGEAHDAPASPATGTPAPLSAGESIQRLPDGSLFVPKSSQHALGIRTQRVQREALAASIELSGTVIADPESSGRVQAPFSGSVHPGPHGMPVGGRMVKKGEVLATLHPLASAIDEGNQKAQLAELEAQLALAERRLQRLEQLTDVLPQKEIEAARIERAALRQRRAFIAASVRQALPLRAPVSGIVSGARYVIAGQMVEAREMLFEIVDPARLAVEALAYDSALAENIRSASLVHGGHSYALHFVGAGRQLRAQALPLLFRIHQADATLALGQPVKVLLRTLQNAQGIALAQQAVSRSGNGEASVWIHHEAERFEPRKIRMQPLDARQIVVSEGLQEGERVVSEGAPLLSRIR